MDHPMMRLTPAMIRDCVFWILFSIAQSEFFKDDWHRSRKWLALGAPLSTDFLRPTPQRVTVISAIYDADKWGDLRIAIDVALSGIPWSIVTKHFIKSKFNHPVEQQLQRLIAAHVHDAEMTTQTPVLLYDQDMAASLHPEFGFEASSDESLDEDEWEWDRAPSSSSSAFPPARPPRRFGLSPYARHQLAMRRMEMQLTRNPQLEDPSFRPRIREEDEQ